MDMSISAYIAMENIGRHLHAVLFSVIVMKKSWADASMASFFVVSTEADMNDAIQTLLILKITKR
ncbi:hypothetical protein AB1I68_04150 [Paenibacillus pabuli]|uniref:hypothetical protein n=1 Tax=Paenibacillus pabuli TaxID=1472 RepID=UPI003457D438